METKTETIEDVLKTAIERGLLDVHTALPGKVVSFNPVKNTVSVEPMINQIMEDSSQQEITTLADVPVQFQRGGGFVLTFPIAQGDEGLIVFNERCIDGWWATGQKSIPLDFRMHDYSDAVFIPGISSVPKAIPNIFMQGAALRTEDDSTYIRLTNGKIFIKGDIEHEGNREQTGNSLTNGNHSVNGNSESSGGTMTHNGKNIGHNHTHGNTQPGSGNSGVPN